MKKLALLLVFLLTGIGFTKAQNWASGIDDDRFNWGYSFHYVSAEYKIWKNTNWMKPIPNEDFTGNITDSLSSLSSKPTPGFAIGFVANRKINSNLDLRSTPSLVFSERNINYSYRPLGTPPIEKKVQATMIELPLSLKLKSDRLKNFRAYMIGGLKYSIDMASQKKNNNAEILDEFEKKINNQKSFISYEAGAGMDFYFGFFKMSTELKVSQSFSDILVHESTIYARPIEKAKLRHFTFSLFFE